MTNVSNLPVYQGWHDWHVDGPAHNGRYHKFFIMVNKSTEAGAQELTNVKVIPANAFYTAGCTWNKFVSKITARQISFETMKPYHMHGNWFTGPESRFLEEQRQIWGVHRHWHAYESLGCTIGLNPGDVLFFREDVFHRTQDMILDRVSFIIDVLRFP